MNEIMKHMQRTLNAVEGAVPYPDIVHCLEDS